MQTYTFTIRNFFVALFFNLFFLVLTAQENCSYYFRSIDGQCNNLEHLEWGSADIPFLREIPSHYGPPDFKQSYSGQGRLNPRAISNLVSHQEEGGLSINNLSSFVYTWGQFIDHDITATLSSETEVEPIPIPDNDPLFRIPIEFKRSAAREGTGINDPRQQLNKITAWIDASNVYGSDQEAANWLRTFQGGKLKTSSGDLLPYNTIDGEKQSPIDPNAPEMAGQDRLPKLFVAGDARANEQPGLTALHTLFVREHNRICDEYIRWGYTHDEDNYQGARAIVAAYIQSITYNEYLPSLGIQLDPYRGYNPEIRPDIMNIFATAAFRYGHSLVEENILLAEDDYLVYDVIPLERAFFNNTVIERNNIQPVLLGLATQLQRATDLQIVDKLRNFLFAPTPNAPGLDLAALNIQRGRDHGLPDYNTVRTHFLGAPAKTWDEITANFETQAKLKEAYGNNLNDVDLWVGLMAEDHQPGVETGPTAAAIIKEQFERLRDGDRFYYEIDPIVDFGVADDIRLSTIISRNTDAYFVPNDVFHVYSGFTNRQENSKNQQQQQVLRIEREKQQATLFPNPTSGIINLNLKNEEPAALDLQVVNVEGKVLQRIERIEIGSFHKSQFDLSNLPNGIYAIQMKVGEKRLYRRIILSH